MRTIVRKCAATCEEFAGNVMDGTSRHARGCGSSTESGPWRRLHENYFVTCRTPRRRMLALPQVRLIMPVWGDTLKTASSQGCGGERREQGVVSRAPGMGPGNSVHTNRHANHPGSAAKEFGQGNLRRKGPRVSDEGGRPEDASGAMMEQAGHFVAAADTAEDKARGAAGRVEAQVNAPANVAVDLLPPRT